jgi:hypothetical protein
LPLSKFELEFTNPAEFLDKTQTLTFTLKLKSFGFVENENKFASILVANTLEFPESSNTLDFPEFSNGDAEISITKHCVEIYYIQFSFGLADTPPNGDWKSQVSISIPGMPTGSSYTYTVEKSGSDSLTLQLIFPNINMDSTT